MNESKGAIVADKELTKEMRAEVLVQALPYIQKYNGKIVVIKYGGSAMVDETLKQQVMEDVVLLHTIGVKVVLVHGGGNEITDTMTALGKESRFIKGSRVTDKETMGIVAMVLGGKVNKRLVNLLGVHGGNAIGVSGIDGHIIRAHQKSEELGYVGVVDDVNIAPILDLLEKGYIPVVSSMGCNDSGEVFNVNADIVAANLAGALHAARLILMTDVPGILADKDDPSSLIPELSLAEAAELQNEGIINRGMVPKVECCVFALQNGVDNVVIMDGRVPHSLLIELLTDEGAGTLLTK